MNWKEQLDNLQDSKQWKSAIDLIVKTINNNSEDVEGYIRIIYLLHNILLEEHDPMANLLRKYFEESYQKFSENPEYLFFVGKILYIAEWYFGIDDDFKPLEEKLAFKMQKKAFEKDSDNQLYQWAYLFSLNEIDKAFLLSNEILNGENKYLNWLKTKGLPGRYIIQSLEFCYENYQKIP
ncbi:hypothetical protein H6G47_19805 [Aphanizomenon flos-aquae FACHB-1416]|uniref:hypothetical protein n=1 Tax=Aphanizomenon flos-aquae TaxID=1176 RepID=UPI001687F70F|nr:hypothetical protein [Aphanizomenon flos-aquae]MBD2676053.1 hypothetical protein [Aphanizomenon flos-aquae FACHB-1416]